MPATFHPVSIRSYIAQADDFSWLRLFMGVEFILILCGASVDLLYPVGLRLALIISYGLMLLVFPLVLQALLRVWQRGSLFVGMLLLYFLLHPLIIWVLVFTDERGFAAGTGYVSSLISAQSYVLNVVLVCLAWVHWQLADFDRFLRMIWRFTYAIALEALIGFYLLRGTVIFSLVVVSGDSDGARFQSFFVRSNYLCGVLGLVLTGMSIWYYVSGKRPVWKYLTGAGLGMVLALASLERSVVGGLMIFISLLSVVFVLARSRFTKPEIMIFKLASILVAVVFGLAAVVVVLGSMRTGSLESANSLIARVFQWMRSVEVAVQYFPFGCGGSLAGLYNRSSLVSNWFTNYLAEWVPEDSPLQQSIRVAAWYSSGLAEGGGRSSTHNTHLELISEYGVLGLLMVLWMFYVPIRYFLRSLRFVASDKQGTAIQAAVLSAMFIAMQMPLFMISQGNILLWAIAIFYIYMQKRYAPVLWPLSSSLRT